MERSRYYGQLKLLTVSTSVALSGTRLIAKQLAPNRRVICAAHSYLEIRGRLQTMEDLLQHDVIAF